MQCPRCKNTDSNYFYLGSKGYYCRKCIQFKRILLEEELEENNYPIQQINYQVDLPFQLTPLQKKASKELLCHLKEGSNVYLNCVCGAGKTEICLESMTDYLNQGKKVCFAISRRQVVLELSLRFQKYFPQAKVCQICAGYTDDLVGDLIVCTTHQLYRFYHSFDLLILDEVDAYPFKGNPVLEQIAQASCKGQIVYSSATFVDVNVDFKVVELLQRPHKHPLAVPIVIQGLSYYLYLKVIHFINNHPKQLLVFVPTKKMAKQFYQFCCYFMRCAYITSEHVDSKSIQQFKNKKLKVIFTTTVLERGVTFSNIDVIVFMAEHRIYDQASLVQIAGRVGRDANYPHGSVYYFCCRKTKAIQASIQQIKLANQSLKTSDKLKR